MKYLIITDNIVTNIILADEAFASSIGAVAAPEGVQIGDTYDGKTFTPKSDSVPVPQSVTMRQARLALYSSGLLDAVSGAVAAGPKSVQIEWEFAATVDRGWPTLAQLQTSLSLSDAQVDALFIQAAAL